MGYWRASRQARNRRRVEPGDTFRLAILPIRAPRAKPRKWGGTSVAVFQGQPRMGRQYQNFRTLLFAPLSKKGEQRKCREYGAAAGRRRRDRVLGDNLLQPTLGAVNIVAHLSRRFPKIGAPRIVRRINPPEIVAVARPQVGEVFGAELDVKFRVI